MRSAMLCSSQRFELFMLAASVMDGGSRMTWRINCSPDTSQEQTLPDISDTSLNLELSNSLVVKGLGLVGPDDTFDVSRGYVGQPQGTIRILAYNIFFVFSYIFIRGSLLLFGTRVSAAIEDFSVLPVILFLLFGYFKHIIGLYIKY